MSLLSCQRFTERYTRSLDEPLRGWDRFAYYFHFCICYVCRRFTQQITFLEGVLKRVGGEPVPPADAAGCTLSSDCCHRIKELLQHDHDGGGGTPPH